MEFSVYKNIVCNNEICGGRPTIKNTRLTVSNIISFVLAGDSDEEVLSAFPYITTEDIQACKEFTTLMLDQKHSVVEISRL